MHTKFDSKVIEEETQALWEKHNVFDFSINPEKPFFSIPLPPPNVTGTLHLGHAFQQTLMDILIRFYRMSGFNVYWQGGTDHAGIATELVVKNWLKKELKDPEKLDRESFIKEVQRWKENSEQNICSQMKKLGLLLNLKKNRFTMDQDYCNTVQDVFIQLYHSGLIYRGLKLVNWDSALKTAISDLEVNVEEKPSFLCTIEYTLANRAEGSIMVSTTRPETIFGDVAIAVNPQDERYSNLIGHKVNVPLCNRTIPIIADKEVDPSFGTGAVKITPAHDFFDEKLAKRHHLPYVQLLNENMHFLKHPIAYHWDATYISNVDYTIDDKIVGKDIPTARNIALELLQKHGALKKKSPHISMVPKGDRSGAIIEPHLTWQWFLKTSDLRSKARDVVSNDTIEFVPDKYKNLYFSWIDKMEDWCISRQITCGHPIPVWFDKNKNFYVGTKAQEIKEKYDLSADQTLTQCRDVLDTWFASALWTFATLEGSNQQLKCFHPFSVLITGFDIIFFWVARMIMLTLQIKKEIPFRTVYFTGLVRDEFGQKMSKSRGNVLDPIDMIEGIEINDLLKKRTAHLLTQNSADKKEKILTLTRKSFPKGIASHGTDALRLTFAALACQGRDVHWDMKRFAGYKHFCNKLWNAARFIHTQFELFFKIHHQRPKIKSHNQQLSQPIAQWIYTQQQKFLFNYQAAIKKYRFDQAASLLHDFFWHTFCDWFLELAKSQLESRNFDQAESVYSTVWMQFEEILRACHPIMPFITEYLWQSLKRCAPTGHNQMNCLIDAMFPIVDHISIENRRTKGELSIDWFQCFVTQIRIFRSETGLAHKDILIVYVESQPFLKSMEIFLKEISQTLIKNVNWTFIEDTNQNDYTDMRFKKIFIEPVAIFIYIPGELEKNIKEKNSKQLLLLKEKQTQLKNKLSNALFLEKAPKAVVQKLSDQYNTLQIQIKALSS